VQIKNETVPAAATARVMSSGLGFFKDQKKEEKKNFDQQAILVKTVVT
jgi:hypothetical protein